jgi:hypothetical protein
MPSKKTETENTQETKVVIPKVLSKYRIEKLKNDAILWERVTLNEEYATEPGVKTFEEQNGRITYYVEKQAKKYSDNVVKS